MKTSVKTLIAGTALAATALFSTGASAQSLVELHEQHKAELSSFLHNLSVSIGIGTPAPVYAPAPVMVAPALTYVDPYGGHHGWRGARGYDEARRGGYDESRRGYSDHAQYDNRARRDDRSLVSPNRQFAQYENGQFKGYVSGADYARPNGNH